MTARAQEATHSSSLARNRLLGRRLLALVFHDRVARTTKLDPIRWPVETTRTTWKREVAELGSKSGRLVHTLCHLQNITVLTISLEVRFSRKRSLAAKLQGIETDRRTDRQSVGPEGIL